MSDLGSTLRRTDMTAPGIQQGAAAMMVHYDRSPQVAVTEWRNVLHNCRDDQMLPLLYVANEVLQNSKRNRGNKFLEAFSPILGQSLVHICKENPTLTEKVRRTAKIWGERRVFSVRYVNDLLQGLEPYRNRRFSPTSDEPQSSSPAKPKQKLASPKQHAKPVLPAIAEKEVSENEEDDGGEFIGDFESPSQHLDIAVPLVAVASSSNKNANKKKRRNSSAVSPSKSEATKKKRRKSVLSTSSLMDLWNQTSSLQQSYDSSMAALSLITPQHLSTDASLVEQLVGDELLEQHKAVVRHQESIAKQRVALHDVASRRHDLEQEAVAYIPWLRTATQQDVDDAKFCGELKQQVQLVKAVHAQVKKRRQLQREKEMAEKKKQQQALAKKKQEEERRLALEKAMSVQTEAKEGEVWNPATREFQKLDTEESWRD